MMKSSPFTKPLVALSSSELKNTMVNNGEKAYRASQVEQWLYHKFAWSYSEMTNVPKPVLKTLEEQFQLSPIKLVSQETSVDGTQKYLLELHDGLRIECVALFQNDRLTACISSQAGCAMQCVFCATGQNGFRRNLHAYEIVEQVRFISHAAKKRVNNVVFMGQGEPFANTNAVIKALGMLNDTSRFGIGARKITVSTAGLPNGIKTLSSTNKQFGLAVSLHSARQSVRDALMPGISTISLEKLKETLQTYNKKTGRRITLEYLLINEINDTNEDVEALLAFCENLHIYVNLLRLHSVPHTLYRPSSQTREHFFLHTLRSNNIEAAIRTSKGADITAACGQLAQNHNFN